MKLYILYCQNIMHDNCTYINAKLSCMIILIKLCWNHKKSEAESPGNAAESPGKEAESPGHRFPIPQNFEIIIHDTFPMKLSYMMIWWDPWFMWQLLDIPLFALIKSFHWFSPSFGWCATLSLGCSPVRLWWLELRWLRWALDYLALLLTPLSWCRS